MATTTQKTAKAPEKAKATSSTQKRTQTPPASKKPAGKALSAPQDKASKTRATQRATTEAVEKAAAEVAEVNPKRSRSKLPEGVRAADITGKCRRGQHDRCDGIRNFGSINPAQRQSKPCACDCGHKNAAKVREGKEAKKAASAAKREARTQERAAKRTARANAPKPVKGSRTPGGAVKQAARDRVVDKVRAVLADGEEHGISDIMQKANLKTGDVARALQSLNGTFDQPKPAVYRLRAETTTRKQRAETR